jgi:hypothetical protein
MEQGTQHTVVEGQGFLRTTSEAIPARYRFDVYQHVALQQRRVVSKGFRETTGVVELIDDPRTIPNGTWNLELELGERWTLLHEDGHWTRVANAV